MKLNFYGLNHHFMLFVLRAGDIKFEAKKLVFLTFLWVLLALASQRKDSIY